MPEGLERLVAGQGNHVQQELQLAGKRLGKLGVIGGCQFTRQLD
jgi:hypothetical protein